MILAQASAAAAAGQSQQMPLQQQHQPLRQQILFQYDNERPSTPPPSTTTAESPSFPLLQTSMGAAYPPVTPTQSPDKHNLMRKHSKSVSHPPVTPARLISKDSNLSPKYASPSEASYASLERSVAVAAEAAAFASYGVSPYQQPPSSGGYFFPSAPSQAYVVSQASQSFQGTPQNANSPASHLSPNAVISPIPLQRTYSTPLPTELEMQYQQQQMQIQFQQHQATQGGKMFSPLAAAVSVGESKLAARRRRLGPPSVRLHRSQSYSAAPPPYISQNQPGQSIPAGEYSAAMNSGESSAYLHLNAAPLMMPLDSSSREDATSGLLRRSKSVSLVQSQPPTRSRKSSVNGRGNGSSTGSSVSSISQQDVIDGMAPMTPITPMTSIANSLQELEVEGHGDAGREYKRLRSRVSDRSSGDGDVTDDDEAQKTKSVQQILASIVDVERDVTPVKTSMDGVLASAFQQQQQQQQQTHRRLYLDTSSGVATISTTQTAMTPSNSRPVSVTDTPSITSVSLHSASPLSDRQSPYVTTITPHSTRPTTPVSLYATAPNTLASTPLVAESPSTNLRDTESLYSPMHQEQTTNPGRSELSNMHQAAAELFLSSPTAALEADESLCSSLIPGVLSSDDITTLEENQRLLMLSRRLDDMGVYGYAALHDYL